MNFEARKKDLFNSFNATYKAFPASIAGFKEEVEFSNSIILPSSALAKLNHKLGLNKGVPMIFKIMNINSQTHTHCGVLDFTAQDECCYIPLHMFKLLGLEEGMEVKISDTKLQKGKLIRIQPHETAFINLPDPKSILEEALKTIW